ncbi:hypothetical protein GCM10023144_08430 [Pigmentiphaga soli]|uniref:histidine kinase n=1 Tax=Pigmentiphaga soli TaxID=1007095 RepID=A0ABP8GK06_9BURK
MPQPAERWLTADAQVFEDRAARLDIDDIAALPDGAGGFEPADAERLRPAYSRSAWWLRLEMANCASEEMRFVLDLGSPRLRQVDFYVERGGVRSLVRFDMARVRNRDAGNETRPAADDDLAGDGIARPGADGGVRHAPHPVLAFGLAPAERVRIFIRVRSELSIQLTPRLSAPDAFSRREAGITLRNGLLLGGLLAMAAYGLTMGLLSRQGLFLLQGLCFMSFALYEASYRGIARLHLWPPGSSLAWRGPPLLASLSHIVLLAYLHRLLAAGGIALPWPRWFAALACANAIVAGAALFGDVRIAAQAAGYMALLQMASLIAAAVRLRAQLARWRLSVTLALGLLLAGALQRVLEDHGLLFLGGLGTSSNPLYELTTLIALLTVFVAWLGDVGRDHKATEMALAAARDETKRRLQQEVERRKRKLGSALREADDIHRQQTRMLAYIGHDLRAPLATIIGYARLLGKNLEPALAAPVRAIERSAEYQLNLIGELLEYTRGELRPDASPPQPLDLDEWLRDIAQYASLLALQQNSRFSYEHPHRLPGRLALDGRRLQRALLNLLAHATRLQSGGAGHLRVTAEPAGAAWRLRFEIVASGGARAEAVPEDDGGLGLYIARRIARSLGGEVSVTSADDATILALTLEAASG